MPGIPRSIAEHKLHVKPDAKLIRQKKRNIGVERQKTVHLEVNKLLKANFILDVTCPEWISNIVLIKKSNRDWRMCIDFTDLNKACPMDHFPLQKIDQLVDSTSGYAFLNFIDAFSGYNQIKISMKDEYKTAFFTDMGLYYYRVMPFGLCNAGATYQRMVNKVFDKQIGKNIEGTSTTCWSRVYQIQTTFVTSTKHSPP